MSMRILAVGPLAPETSATLERLARRGWGSYAVDSLGDAKSVFKTIRFDVILASEFLSDGRGYELAETVASSSATLLVGVTLSESCLWLPVVDCGDNVLGQRALHPRLMELEMESLLSQPAAKSINAISSIAGGATNLRGSKLMIPPRRPVIMAIPAANRGTREEDGLLPAKVKGEAHASDRFDAKHKHVAAGVRHPARHD